MMSDPKEHGLDWNETFDVVVVGSGIAGLATALAARELGLRPVMLEKAAKLGGGTAFANGGIWIGDNHLMRAAGYGDSRDAVLAYMRFIAGDQAVEENLLAFVDHGPPALKFFEDCGIAFRISKGLSDHYYDAAPGSVAEGRCLNTDFIAASDLGSWEDRILAPRDTPLDVNSEELIAWGGITNIDHWPKDIMADRRRRRIRTRGVGVVMHFVKQLLRREVPIRLAAAVDELVVARGRVAGVAMKDGTRIGAARGVMLATGAYESNPALAKIYEGLPGWLSMFPPTIQGDGMVMAGEIGAQVRTIHNNMALFLGFDIPAERPGEAPLFRLVGISEMLCPHTIVVNKDGRRFADESYFQAMVPSLRSYHVKSHRHANLPCYLVFDQQYVDGFSFAGGRRGGDIPAWVARADTPAALAAALGIDAAGLSRTVAGFNDFARAGVDADFGRGKTIWSLARKDQWQPTRADERYVNPSLGTLRIAPFYGVELHPSAFASAGLLTNARAQVIDQRQQPIPGLYAAGNAAAHTEYGVGYQAGHSFASGMIFGYLGAHHMAEAKH
jgi:succinate dehydrogenase/fumarate reductase flavoprotein subunit